MSPRHAEMISGFVRLSPALLAFLGSAVVIHHQLNEFIENDETPSILLWAVAVLLGAMGIQRVLDLEIRKKLVGLEAGLRGIGKVEAKVGVTEIEAAAMDLISSCGPQASVKATAQNLFSEGLGNNYYKMIKAKMAQAAAQKRGFSYLVVVHKDRFEEAQKKRSSLFGDFPDRCTLLTSKKTWPFDVLVGGDGAILAISGNNKEGYNCGLYVKDREIAEIINQWFDNAILNQELEEQP